MESKELIQLDLFCKHHEIELTFLNALHEMGLIEIVSHRENRFLETERLPEIEKMIYWHYELDINLEGIDTIIHLLGKMNHLQQELTLLKNRLSLYENESEAF